MRRFNDCYKKNRPHWTKSKVIFHQDNARLYKCIVAMAKLIYLNCPLHSHPPYYPPDLGPCDYFQFPNMKIRLGGKGVVSIMKSSPKRTHVFVNVYKSHYYEVLENLRKVEFNTIQFINKYHLSKWVSLIINCQYIVILEDYLSC